MTIPSNRYKSTEGKDSLIEGLIADRIRSGKKVVAKVQKTQPQEKFSQDYELDLEHIWSNRVAKDTTGTLDNIDHTICKCCKHVDTEADKK